jgi:hypothetical protein
MLARKKRIEFELSNRPDINSLCAIDIPANVEKIIITDCIALTDLSALSNLANLQYITINNCPNLIDLKPITAISSLIKLRIFGAPNLDMLHSLKHETREIYLQLVQSHAMFSGFHQKKEDTLYVYIQVEKLGDLLPITSLATLKRLRFDYCNELQNIEELAHCIGLSELQFSYCPNLVDCSPVAKLKNLHSLRLLFCPKIETIDPALEVQSLKELELVRCDAIKEIRFQPVNQLIDLRLHDNRQLSKLIHLEYLAQLRFLMLEHCDAFYDYSTFSVLQRLEELHLFYAKNLKSKAFIKKLKNLKILRIQVYKYKWTYHNTLKTIYINKDYNQLLSL